MRKGATTVEYQRIKVLAESGKTIEQISVELHIIPETVGKILDHFGITGDLEVKPRKRSRAKKDSVADGSDDAANEAAGDVDHEST